MENKKVLTVFGVVSVLFAVVYAILGILALVGKLEGVLPGHEKGEVLIIVIAFAIALFSLVCGIACCKGNLALSRVFGLIFAAVGLFSLIYMQITQDTFNIFDCIAMVLGIAIFTVAKKAE